MSVELRVHVLVAWLPCCVIHSLLFTVCSLGFFFSDFPGFYAQKSKHVLLPTSDVGYVTAVFYLVASLGAPLLQFALCRTGASPLEIVA